MDGRAGLSEVRVTAPWMACQALSKRLQQSIGTAATFFCTAT
jgi:hypothetical protein